MDTGKAANLSQFSLSQLLGRTQRLAVELVSAVEWSVNPPHKLQRPIHVAAGTEHDKHINHQVVSNVNCNGSFTTTTNKQN